MRPGSPVRWTLPDLPQALSWCERRNREGIRCTLHVLDEYVRTEEAAEGVARAYRQAITGIRERGLRASVSVKLSSLGMLSESGTAVERTAGLCREADRAGVGFEIDMEGKGLVGAAIEAAGLCRRGGHPVTLALQANLHRTPGDVRLLLAQGITPRFVKGAYHGDISDGDEIRERFLALVREVHGYGIAYQVGTHDPALIHEIRTLTDTTRDRVGFGFLLGLADRTKLDMAADGWRISEYIPYGEDGAAYIARRERYLRELAEAGREPAP